MDFDMNMTLSDALVFLKELNAGVFKFTGEGEGGKPVFSIIIVRGDGTQDILSAVQAIEDKWDEASASIAQEQGNDI